MKLAIVIPYLDKLSPGQVELALQIKELDNPLVRGVLCGLNSLEDPLFFGQCFDTMLDPRKGIDAVILKGLSDIDADYIWFFGDDYIQVDGLSLLYKYLLSQPEKHPLLLATKSLKNIELLPNERSHTRLSKQEFLSGNEAFLRFSDQLGYISRVIYVPTMVRPYRDKLVFFMGTNWVSLAAIIMSLFPLHQSAKVINLQHITVYGVDRDQSVTYWYGYETFLYGTLEIIRKLAEYSFPIPQKSMDIVARGIMWRALKARIVQSMDGITHGYANDWDFKRLRPLMSRAIFWSVYCAYFLDFPFKLAARLKRWKRLFS